MAREAEVIAHAGERERITVATNMAGRGTDIRLGDGVAELGGLYVICSELHDSSRIDRQLIGRCGRQGDPGLYRRYFSLDDDVLRDGLGREAAQRLIDGATTGSLASLLPHFERAQRNLERRHARQLRLLSEKEKRHRQQQEQLGHDPFLDLVD